MPFKAIPIQLHFRPVILEHIFEVRAEKHRILRKSNLMNISRKSRTVGELEAGEVRDVFTFPPTPL